MDVRFLTFFCLIFSLMAFMPPTLFNVGKGNPPPRALSTLAKVTL